LQNWAERDEIMTSACARLELENYPLKNIRKKTTDTLRALQRTMIEENPTRVIIAKICLVSYNNYSRMKKNKNH
jgi:hypothetical protein